jgi:diguanylate cyclase (GGDEF)-like protein/putative nucleotidyltransferase with HDIG domain
MHRQRTAPWSTPPNPSSPPVAERAARILLVDGGGRTRDDLLPPLLEGGYDVVPRASSVGLPAVLDEVQPDLLLLDANLPDASIYEVCGELRATETGRQTPIMVISAEPTAAEAAARALLCGADDFCVVGGRLPEVLARVRVQLRNKRDRDRLRRARHERDHARREAVADPLTGIPDRRSVEASVAAAVSAAAPFALLFVDVDHLRALNETLGQEAGDQALKAVAGCLSRQIRGDDRCGRYGGEELLVMVADLGPDLAVAVGERHRRAVEQLRPPALLGRGLTVSVGVAAFEPDHPESADTLIRRAENAVHEAKRRGRNRVVLAQGEPTLRVVPPGLPSLPLPITPVSLRPSAPRAAPSALEAALVERLESGLAGLPLLAESSAEALQLAGDAHTDIAKIARLVDRDPPLAARFVAVASSALYAGRAAGKAATTQQALVRIGLATARDLLYQVVYERSGRDLPRYKREVSASFKHSVRTALAARAIATELGLDLPYAYLAGLLHDIGEARLYRVLAQMPMSVAPEGSPIVAELVTRHHARAGAGIAEIWKLPAVISEACAGHHGDPEKARPHVRVVMAADLMVGLCDAGGTVGEADMARLAAVGVRAERVRSLCGAVGAVLGEPDGTSLAPIATTTRPSMRMR